MYREREIDLFILNRSTLRPSEGGLPERPAAASSPARRPGRPNNDKIDKCYYNNNIIMILTVIIIIIMIVIFVMMIVVLNSNSNSASNSQNNDNDNNNN